jgi:predicted DNA-binding transcriptional regulator AlpA
MDRAASKIGAPGVIWSTDLEHFYNITKPTRLRWEALGTLPPRTVLMGGRSGWLASDLPDVAAWLATRRAQSVADQLTATNGVQML